MTARNVDDVAERTLVVFIRLTHVEHNGSSRNLLLGGRRVNFSDLRLGGTE
jgi:hypothetical protein